MQIGKPFMKTALILSFLFLGFHPSSAQAHCDTMDGPVVTEAKNALEKGDITPILKWIDKNHEKEAIDAFRQTLIVRNLSPEAKALADRFFFETIVRIHRISEGASYTGLKPAGTSLEPIVIEADQALITGSAIELTRKISEEIAAGIQNRFTNVVEKKKMSHESVEAGRAYVAAYIEYIHYIEQLNLFAVSTSPSHQESEDLTHQH